MSKQQQDMLREQAYKFITMALDRDAKKASPTPELLRLYRQGQGLLVQALRIRLPPHLEAQMKPIHLKMVKNLKLVEERIGALQSMVHSAPTTNTRGSTPSSPSPRHDRPPTRPKAATERQHSFPITGPPGSSHDRSPVRQQTNGQQSPLDSIVQGISGIFTSSSASQTPARAATPPAHARHSEQSTDPYDRDALSRLSVPRSNSTDVPRSAPVRKFDGRSSDPTMRSVASSDARTSQPTGSSASATSFADRFPQLRGLDKKLLTHILDEVIDHSERASFDSIAGLHNAKRTLQELVILPNLRPDIFTGLRQPPKGVLLFGPPGNGKTMLAKAVAHESKGTFFNISSSTLTSKYVGEGEKLVRALFACARVLQPAVVFIDEIDSLLSSRSSEEHEASRRLKTEFLVQVDGVGTDAAERILLMGATNRPQDLDSAVLRRMPKRLYVSLPDQDTRIYLIEHLLARHSHSLSKRDIASVAVRCDNFSAADLRSLCTEAAMGPVRSLGASIRDAPADSLRAISMSDFEEALAHVRPSVDPSSLVEVEEWAARFASA